MGWFNEQLLESAQKDKADLKNTYKNIEAGLDRDNRLKIDVREESRVSIAELFRFVYKYITPKENLVIIIITLVSVGLGFAIPELTHYMVTEIPETSSNEMLRAAVIWISLAAFFMCVFDGICQIVSSYYSNRATNRVTAELMDNLFDMPSGFFRKYSAADLATRLDYVDIINTTVFAVVYDNILGALISLVYLIEVVKYAPSMVIPSLVIMLITLAVSLYVSNEKAKVFKVCLRADLNESEKFSEFLNAIQKIKTSGSEKRAFTVWGTLYEKSVRANYNPPFIVRYSSAIVAGVTFLCSAAIYLIAAKSGMKSAEYFTFMSIYAVMTASLVDLPTVVEQLSQAGACFEIIKPIYNHDRTESKKLPDVEDISGAISIKNLTFSYDGRRNIIEDFNLEIKSGEYLAITGESGCGKSTLMRLLLGLEDPSAGMICYDDHNLAEVNKASVRRHIGSVVQGAKLLDDSIRNNVAIVNPFMSDEEIWSALEAANIAEEVNKMPMKLETMMNESTGAVSGGQKQRILLASALATKPSVLILDEATSAMDNIAQKRVTSVLDGLKCTRIIVAHRLSTIRNCDRIIYIENGKIADDGTYEELLAKGGGFAELIERQKL